MTPVSNPTAGPFSPLTRYEQDTIFDTYHINVELLECYRRDLSSSSVTHLEDATMPLVIRKFFRSRRAPFNGPAPSHNAAPSNTAVSLSNLFDRLLACYLKQETCPLPHGIFDDCDESTIIRVLQWCEENFPHWQTLTWEFDYESMADFAARKGFAGLAAYLGKPLRTLTGNFKSDLMAAYFSDSANKIPREILPENEEETIAVLENLFEEFPEWDICGFHFMWEENNSDSFLCTAIRAHRPELAKFLIERGTDIHEYNGFALQESISNSLPDIVCILLEKGMLKEINTSGPETPPLILAAYHKFYDIVKRLLDAGADVNILYRDPRIGYMSALSYVTMHEIAAPGTQVQLISLLLERGAQANPNFLQVQNFATLCQNVVNLVPLEEPALIPVVRKLFYMTCDTLSVDLDLLFENTSEEQIVSLLNALSKTRCPWPFLVHHKEAILLWAVQHGLKLLCRYLIQEGLGTKTCSITDAMSVLHY